MARGSITSGVSKLMAAGARKAKMKKKLSPKRKAKKRSSY